MLNCNLFNIYFYFRTGVLYDITLHYPISFYVAGVVAGLGGLVMIPTLIGPKIKPFEQKALNLGETCDLPKDV